MVDAGKVVGALAIALLVGAVPVWMASARGVKFEALAKASGGDRCVAPLGQIRKSHPALLASWRERVVSLGDSVHHMDDGRDVRISLTGTCIGCHRKASEFCDKCHAQ